MLSAIVEIYRHRGLLEHEVEFFKWLAEREQAKRIEQLERLNTIAVESINKKSDRIAELEATNAAQAAEIAAKDGYIDDLEAKYAAACDRNQELEGQVAMYWQELTPEQKFDDAYGMLNQ